MASFWSVVRYTYLRRNPLLWVLLVVLPVLVSVFLLQLFDARSPLHMPIGIVQQDNSPLARRLVRGLDANAAMDVVRFCSDLPTCEQGMRNGELLGVVHLPPSLEKNALHGDAPMVPIYLNGQSMVAYNTLFKEIRAVIAAEGARIDRRNLPDPVRTQLHAIRNPSLDYLAFLGVAMLAAVFHMAAMVVAVYLVGEPLRDRTANVLLALTGGNPIRVITGRLLPALVVLWMLALLFAVWARARTGLILALPEFALLAFGTLSMLAACMAAGLAWTGFSGNMRMASSTAGVIGGPAFAFSGITFPLIAMPAAVQVYAQLLPLTHFLQLQNHLLFSGIGHIAVVKQLVILWGMTLFWMLLGLPLLCKRLRSPHFHGGHREEPFA
jgi:ABC-2 type transport system permease protein